MVRLPGWDYRGVIISVVHLLVRCLPGCLIVLTLCVPKTPSTSCDQVIFVDQATDASLPSDTVPRKIDRLG